VPGSPAAETCDDLDNDCDGVADNGFTLGQACSAGTGQCQAAGVTVCSANGAGTTCNAVPGSPAAETCDDLDNDCDGVADNGFTLGQACSAGTGQCQAAGVTVCSANGTGTTCNAVPGSPAAETCDGLDNDCDGVTDNAAVPAAFVQNLSLIQVSGATHVSWDPVPDATGYDLILGSLAALLSSGGDFAISTNECVANDTSGTEAVHAAEPAPGSGVYYLVRPLSCGGNGSYNEGSQTGLRDSEIIASGFGCQ